MGPVYFFFDVTLKETKWGGIPSLPDPARHRPPPPAHAAPALIEEAVLWLRSAKRPLLLMGRVTRDIDAWQARVRLAESLNARVLTDLKVGAAFPTDHPLHVAPPGIFLSPQAAAALKDADVVLSLDWVDLAGPLKQAWGAGAVGSRVFQVAADQTLHNAFSMDHQALPPTDLYLFCAPEPAVADLLRAIEASPRVSPAKSATAKNERARGNPVATTDDARISIAMVADALKLAVGDDDVCLPHLPLGWSGEMWDFRHPLDFIGADGGGGIGAGPGLTVGAAIALKGGKRLPIAILGDGDYLMGASALWTAATSGVPFLAIVCNNRSFYNDEVHQERVAKERERPDAKKRSGERNDDPAPDLAMMARGEGGDGIGPVQTG